MVECLPEMHHQALGSVPGKLTPLPTSKNQSHLFLLASDVGWVLVLLTQLLFWPSPPSVTAKGG